MKGDVLPDDHHVTRNCLARLMDGDQVTGQAFRLRAGQDGDEEFLSVNWLESFRTPNQLEAVRAVCRILRRKRTVPRSSEFAILNVGSVCGHVRQKTGFDLTVQHEPENDDPSHAGIYGYSPEDEIVADRIAECILSRVRASEVLD